jgi:hypothetical protein
MTEMIQQAQRQTPSTPSAATAANQAATDIVSIRTPPEGEK